jgi:FKBP-type peptidyl-prolyl cis-trans isomerase
MLSRKTLAALAAATALAAGAALSAEDKKPATTQPAAAMAVGKETKTPSGLGITIVEEAKTPGAQTGDIVWVHYTGKLQSGEQFDSSVGRSPFKFTLGQGQVIKGWDEGVVGMKIGEKRKLVIPSELGYGAQGSPPKIPGGSTLVFDVEVIGIARPAGQ